MFVCIQFRWCVYSRRCRISESVSARLLSDGLLIRHVVGPQHTTIVTALYNSSPIACRQLHHSSSCELVVWCLSEFCCPPLFVVGCARQGDLLHVLSHPERVLRHTAGSISTTIVGALGLVGWPELVLWQVRWSICLMWCQLLILLCHHLSFGVYQCL